MDRTINRKKTAEPGRVGAMAGQPGVDDYRTRILKLIPAEVVAAYLTIKGLMDTATAQNNEFAFYLYWGVFAVLLVLTPVFYVKVEKVNSLRQNVITTLAFVVWVFSIGGPFDSLFQDPANKNLLASVLLILFTLVAPQFFLPEKEEAGVLSPN